MYYPQHSTSHDMALMLVPIKFLFDSGLFYGELLDITSQPKL